MMTRYIAFLRAINVGGHTVKMDALRAIFKSLGFSNVETFIASGNVIFESASKDNKSLESSIGKKLHEELDYEVAAFIRTDVELAAIADYKPFKKSELDLAIAFNVAFLTDALDASSKKKLMTLKTDIDDFHVHGREIYWLCLKKQSESTFSNVLLEKTLGRQSTLRGINTVRKIVEKYPSRS
jgi:uncharacterized protein (DUF1697 family)